MLDKLDTSLPLSLYIHVPFCNTKCSYCAFYSKGGCSAKTKHAYVEKLVSEIEELNRTYKKPFYTAFIGGGNPGCLSSSQLGRIAEEVCRNGRPVEFTTEINPESFTCDYFPLFQNCFNRISMGVQSLSEKALEFLGRNSSLQDTKQGMKRALEVREKYGTSINFDIITCLPSWHNSLDDLKEICENYSPDHLSLYSLTLEEGTPLEKKKPILPDSDSCSKTLIKLWGYLKSQNFEHYEVSNFAKDGKKSLHNSVYWKYEPYIGLGPGSASTLFKNGRVYRVEAQKSIEEYIRGPLFKTYKETEVLPNEQKEELVMLGLRHKEGLDLSRLGVIPKQKFRGFRTEQDHLVPDDEGFLIADRVALDIICALI